VLRDRGIPPGFVIHLFDVTDRVRWMKIEYGFFLDSGVKKKGS